MPPPTTTTAPEVILDPQVAADTSGMADRTSAWIAGLALIPVVVMMLHHARRHRHGRGSGL